MEQRGRFFVSSQYGRRTKGASILTAVSPAKPNCRDRELMSDLYSNKPGNVDYISMFADRKAKDSDEDDSESDEEGDAPRFNFVGSNPPPKPKYVCGVPHGCDLQCAARQQKERDKDASKAGGDKIFFFLSFFWFVSPVFLVFFFLWCGQWRCRKRSLFCGNFYFFCGG